MRILGLDVGEKRIGIALTDMSGKIAYPFTVIENNPQVKEKLLNLLDKHVINRVIVGLPYNLKGEEGFQAKQIREFVQMVFGDIGIPVIFQDERFTSRISENNIVLKKRVKNSGKTSLKKSFRKNYRQSRISGQTDKLSASLILGDYINKTYNDSEE